MSQCKIKITLENIRYFGNDVGDDWYFGVVLTSDGAFKAKQEFYTRKITHLDTVNIDDVLVDVTTDNCEGPHGDGLYRLTFDVKAKEIDRGLDDNADKAETRTVECSYDDYVDVNVIVQEKAKGFFGWLLNRHKKARITLKFHVELNCV